MTSFNCETENHLKFALFEFPVLNTLFPYQQPEGINVTMKQSVSTSLLPQHTNKYV